MELSLIGLKDVLFLAGALLGFASAFIIPPRGSGSPAGRKTVLLLGVAILALGVTLLLLTLASESDLRWWVNSAGLLLLGGVVVLGWRRSRLTTATPVVARTVEGVAAGTSPVQQATPAPQQATPTPQQAAAPQGQMESVKVACPSCGAVITVEPGATWIKCPGCGLEGRMGR